MVLMVTGSWKPSDTSLKRSFLRVDVFDLADFWLPLAIASLRSVRLLVLLIRSREYFAHFYRLEFISSQNKLKWRSGARILDGQNSEP